MGKSVLELGVNTGQWDAGLKKAGSALNNFVQANGGLQQALQKDDKSIASFVQMMGKMESTATTAKGRMNDYKRTIEQLTEQFNHLTAAQKASVGAQYTASIDQITQKYKAAAAEVQKLNASLSGGQVAGPKLAAGGSTMIDSALSVLGGNLMTKGVMVLSEFAAGMGEMVKQGVELARAGEGVYLAFQRLNDPGLLDNLRQATHGTVTDLDLMKAAVKFNDFKLPLEELGTMLAFAQQKAKDTGQSVDYMVDSIVTGLGRKSLMILDNLGLSASEVRERMKETGDMTKAVGDIIRDQMSKAGEYVETAADRATQADVKLTNAIANLGRTFQPLSEHANSAWTDMKIGALDLLNNAVQPLIDALAKAGTLGAKAGITAYEHGLSPEDRANTEKLYNAYKAGGTTDAEIKKKADDATAALKKERDAVQDLYEQILALNKASMYDYQTKLPALHQRAKAMLPGMKDYDWGYMARYIAGKNDDIAKQEYLASLATPAPKVEPVTTAPTSATTAKPTTEKELTPLQEIQKRISDLSTEALTADEARREEIKNQIAALQQEEAEYKKILDYVKGINKETEPKTYDVTFAGPDQSPFEALQQSISIKLADQAALVDENSLRNLMTVAMQNGIDSLNLDFASLQAKMAEGMDIPDEVWTKLEEQINAELKKLNLDPIKLDISTGAVKTAEKEATALEFGWVKAAQAVEQVGSAIQSIEDPSAKIAGIIASAIANVAAGLGGILASQEAMANPWNWVALALSGTATMISTVSAIKSATAGSYANGGVIPGTHYSGDMQLAAVNAGETILSVAQTGVVADALKNSPLENIRLEAIISGRDLRLVLANNDRFFGGSRGDYVVATSRS